MHQFRLSDRLIQFNPISVDGGKDSNHQFQLRRDHIIIDQADILCPISLRPNGNLEKIITPYNSRHKTIDNQFRIDYARKRRKLKLDIDGDYLSAGTDKRLEGYLIHWTRTANHPWPGETLYEYYDSIVSSSNSYPRTAVDTLYRIFVEKKIRASIRHYRKGAAAVAFSELVPSKAIKLMKWRARYREMSFEPFGLAIDKKYAIKIGIRPAIYGDSELYNSLSSLDKPYYQPIGKKAHWLPEKEWRYMGDLDLNHIPLDYIKAVVWNNCNIGRLQSVFAGEIASLCD
jgi:hypothetical protein